MKCPHCETQANPFITLLTCPWKNYKCRSCSSESNITKTNAILVYLVGASLFGTIELFIHRFSLDFSFAAELVVFLACLLVSEIAFGKLYAINQT
jgi:hypothetical protein